MSDQKYVGNGSHDWEKVVDRNGGGSTVRLRVPGGWLYNVCNGIGQVYNTVFVPMPEVVKHKV